MTSAKLPHVRLGHILDEVEAIMAATEGMTAEAVLNDYVTRRAVERAIQIISEATKELPVEMRQQEPSVPWSQIIGIGNLLRHEYYRIKPDTIQAILFEHFAELRPVILRLLAQQKP